MTFGIYLKNIFQLLLSPANAWREIENEETPPMQLTSRGLYPLMALMLLSVFIGAIYSIGSFDLILLLQTAMTQFVAIYIAFHLGRYAMDSTIKRYNSSGQNDPIATETVAAYGAGLLTLIQIVMNLLPLRLALMQLLPIFATIGIWKAYPYLDITDQGELPFMLMASSAIIAPVIVLNTLFNYIIL